MAALDSFDFEIPTNKVGWTRSQSRSAQVSYPTIGGAIQGSASASVTIEFIPDQNSPWEAIVEGFPGLTFRIVPCPLTWTMPNDLLICGSSRVKT
ncbi:MAG: hypothetical protein NTW03_02400 [Verrucomicrobia bacterium]|nr:hypothetical protein [Verrucomicrobiota bacterium]